MSRFNVDFTKSNEEIIKEIDIVLKEAGLEVDRTSGSLRKDYDKIIETLPVVRELLEKGERITALSKATDLAYSLEH